MSFIYQAPSFFLFIIASRIRLMSFFPVFSLCLRETFAATLFHPASSVSFLLAAINFFSFSTFSRFRSWISSSFFCVNYSSWTLPVYFLFCFSSYSLFLDMTDTYCFIPQLFLDFFLLLLNLPRDLVVLLWPEIDWNILIRRWILRLSCISKRVQTN